MAALCALAGRPLALGQQPTPGANQPRSEPGNPEHLEKQVVLLTQLERNAVRRELHLATKDPAAERLKNRLKYLKKLARRAEAQPALMGFDSTAVQSTLTMWGG